MPNIFANATPINAPPLFGVDAQAINIVTIPLDKARTEVERDFGASTFIWVVDATTLTAELGIKFNSQSGGLITLKKGMLIRGVHFARAYLTNAAQPGESVTLVTLQEGTEGAEGLVTIENPASDASTVTLTRPSVLDTVADVSAAATSVTQVLAANADRFKAFIQNLSPSVTLRIGDGNVDASRGVLLKPFERIEIEATEAISVYNPSAGAVDVAVMETAA